MSCPSFCALVLLYPAHTTFGWLHHSLGYRKKHQQPRSRDFCLSDLLPEVVNYHLLSTLSGGALRRLYYDRKILLFVAHTHTYYAANVVRSDVVRPTNTYRHTCPLPTQPRIDGLGLG